MKVLMVCLGNICRSPLAEGIMREKIRKYSLDWEVDSAGTGAWHIGHRPDPRSEKEAKFNGIDISGQRARQIQSSDLDEFDLIFTMDESNFRDVSNMCQGPGQKSKVHRILAFSTQSDYTEVPDPYWDDDGFNLVYELLENACQGIVDQYGKE